MAMPVILYPAALIAAFSGLLVPELTEAEALSHRHHISYMISRVWSLSLLFSIGVAGILICFSAEIGEMDSYEMTANKLTDHTDELKGSFKELKKAVGSLEYRFAYPEIESSLRVSDVKKTALLKTLRAVIGTLDPTLTDISIARDLKDSFVIRRRNDEIIIQEGKLLNREMLSSGTAEGIDVAVFLASMLSERNCFYYCDEHFSYIQSDIEKRIFGLMVERLGRNEQLIFTTHNTDMLNLNLPKHTFAFMKKEIDGNEYRVSVTFASEFLKRNTDSVKCAMENDVFGSLPDDSLLDDLEVTDI
jgi:hypothetical protein